MKMNNLEDLFVHELCDIYNAEQQLLKALPEMAKAADNEELRAGFEHHLQQTERHVERLESIFEQVGESPGRGVICKGMKGLLQEGSEMIKQDADRSVRDAGLIAAAQRVEHYEIAAYGTARTYAEMLGHEDAVELLNATLDEEKETDQKLTDIAESVVNVEAAESGESSGDSGSRKGKK